MPAIRIGLDPSPFGPAENLRGISRCGATVGNWSYSTHALRDPAFVTLINRGPYDGMIISGPPQALLRRIRKPFGPIVIIQGADHTERFCLVRADDDAIGRCGAAHLLALHPNRTFCFLGVDAVFSRTREAGFVAAVRAAGHTCHVAQRDPERPASRLGWWDLDFDDRVWAPVSRLPRPVAVMTAVDSVAARLVKVVTARGWRVPEDFAIVGVDNNPLACEFQAVPLSSVPLDLEQMGFEAAALLSRLMEGRGPSSPFTITVPPLAVVSRRSTDRAAPHDAEVTAALTYIRAHACAGAGMPELLDHLQLSRSTLERRFAAQLGCAPGDEIRRIRLERAAQLLTMTNLRLTDIAVRSGFSSIAYLSRAFRAAYGQSPRAFRRATVA